MSNDMIAAEANLAVAEAAAGIVPDATAPDWPWLHKPCTWCGAADHAEVDPIAYTECQHGAPLLPPKPDEVTRKHLEHLLGRARFIAMRYDDQEALRLLSDEELASGRSWVSTLHTHCALLFARTAWDDHSTQRRIRNNPAVVARQAELVKAHRFVGFIALRIEGLIALMAQGRLNDLDRKG